jgi:hypothetical protein
MRLNSKLVAMNKDDPPITTMRELMRKLYASLYDLRPETIEEMLNDLEQSKLLNRSLDAPLTKAEAKAVLMGFACEQTERSGGGLTIIDNE